jgi:hypothetical protein
VGVPILVGGALAVFAGAGVPGLAVEEAPLLIWRAGIWMAGDVPGFDGDCGPELAVAGGPPGWPGTNALWVGAGSPAVLLIAGGGGPLLAEARFWSTLGTNGCLEGMHSSECSSLKGLLGFL